MRHKDGHLLAFAHFWLLWACHTASSMRNFKYCLLRVELSFTSHFFFHYFFFPYYFVSLLFSL